MVDLMMNTILISNRKIATHFHTQITHEKIKIQLRCHSIAANKLSFEKFVNYVNEDSSLRNFDPFFIALDPAR